MVRIAMLSLAHVHARGYARQVADSPDGEIVSVAGGSPYNSVRAIARLGVTASWVGGLSSDRFGRMLEDGLAGDGVERELVQRTDLPTTLALAELGADGSASYRFYTEATSAPNVLPGPLAGGIPPSARASSSSMAGWPWTC